MLTVRVTVQAEKKAPKPRRTYPENDRQLAPLNQVKMALDFDSGDITKPASEPRNSYVLNRKCHKRLCEGQRLWHTGGACALPKLSTSGAVSPDSVAKLSRKERLSDVLPPMRFHANDGPVFEMCQRRRVSRFSDRRRDVCAAPSHGTILHTLKPTLDSILKSSAFVAQQTNNVGSNAYAI